MYSAGVVYMKKITCFAFLLISLLVNVAHSDCESPYQMAIESDSVSNNVSSFTIPIYYHSTKNILGMCNGFTITTIGDIDITVDSIENRHYGCIGVQYDYYEYEGDVDSILMGWASPGPIHHPLHPTDSLTEYVFMHVTIEKLIEYAEGIIIIDSTAQVGLYGPWLWNMGSIVGEVYPSFNCGEGPAVITYCQAPVFCGDANSDGTINVTDAVYIINYIFVGGDAPYPLENAEVNCDGLVNVSDAVWIMNYIFYSGNAPCDVDGEGEPDC
jgi:Dockerin type I domain